MHRLQTLLSVMLQNILSFLDARFINLQLSTLTDKWYGESQKLAAAVFSLAEKIQPAIIFIDEIGMLLTYYLVCVLCVSKKRRD